MAWARGIQAIKHRNRNPTDVPWSKVILRTHITYIHTYVRTYIHYITLHYITLHCIALHYITLHYITLHYIHTYIIYNIIEGSLEVKLPTIWTDEKQSREEAERRERLEERRVEEKE